MSKVQNVDNLSKRAFLIEAVCCSGLDRLSNLSRNGILWQQMVREHDVSFLSEQFCHFSHLNKIKHISCLYLIIIGDSDDHINKGKRLDNTSCSAFYLLVHHRVNIAYMTNDFIQFLCFVQTHVFDNKVIVIIAENKCISTHTHIHTQPYKGCSNNYKTMIISCKNV